MKVLIAMDSFKGSLGSLEAAEWIEKGIRRVYGDAWIQKVMVADGGEGTMETMLMGTGGDIVELTVLDPLGRNRTARYGITKEYTAIIEMAEASGLCLLSAEERNPLATTSYGTGQLIMDAVHRGCKQILLGIGGSATNDGGVGMAEALGVRFLDQNGRMIPKGGGYLDKLDRIDRTQLDPRIERVRFQIACDVDNPLCGQNGASKVFGPQKGATPEMMERLDCNLAHYADIVQRDMGIDIRNVPGAGAAGGLGGGMIAFCNGKLTRGIELVLDGIDIDSMLQCVDVVITGEGRLDHQTAHGKAPAGVATRAAKWGKPVFAIGGSIGEGADSLYDCGVDGILSAVAAPMSLEQAMRDAGKNLEEVADRLFRIIKGVEKIYTVRE